MPWYAKRKPLHHTPPPWVDRAKALFFITICCQPRGANQLANEPVATRINEALEFRSKQSLLFTYTLLLMPDHLHAIVGYNDRLSSLEDTIASLKQRIAQQNGVRWQKGFFDHRIRNDRGYQEKVDYILNNPVSAGLCATTADWPYLWFADQRQEADGQVR